MNMPSQISLYDLLSMIVPGFVILWIIGFLGLNLNAPIECTFIVILCYPVGLIFHRVIECLFNSSKKCWETSMLQKTWEEKWKEENKNNTEKENDSRKVNKQDYNRAYYNMVQNNCQMNIPVLEAQEVFLRNSPLIILLSIGKVSCCYCDKEWYRHVVILLLILFVTSIFAWHYIQRKIFKIVWESEYYLKETKDEKSVISGNHYD